MRTQEECDEAEQEKTDCRKMHNNCKQLKTKPQKMCQHSVGTQSRLIQCQSWICIVQQLSLFNIFQAHARHLVSEACVCVHAPRL